MLFKELISIKSYLVATPVMGGCQDIRATCWGSGYLSSNLQQALLLRQGYMGSYTGKVVDPTIRQDLRYHKSPCIFIFVFCMDEF